MVAQYLGQYINKTCCNTPAKSLGRPTYIMKRVCNSVCMSHFLKPYITQKYVSFTQGRASFCGEKKYCDGSEFYYTVRTLWVYLRIDLGRNPERASQLSPPPSHFLSCACIKHTKSSNREICILHDHISRPVFSELVGIVGEVQNSYETHNEEIRPLQGAHILESDNHQLFFPSKGMFIHKSLHLERPINSQIEVFCQKRGDLLQLASAAALSLCLNQAYSLNTLPSSLQGGD